MTVSVKVAGQNTLDGKSYSKSRTLTGAGAISKKPTLGAAKAGTLTTRTDNDTGTLTMATGHGITTGQKLDLYWENADGTRGSRRNMTVGTVAGDSVPIDLGTGDNLPIATTAIRAMVPTSYDFRFDGDELVALMASCPDPFTVVLTGDDDVEDYAMVSPYAGGAITWDKQEGSINPVATDTITKAWITHGGSVSRDVQVGVALSV